MRSEKLIFWEKQKEVIVSGLIIIICLFLLALFPSQSAVENIFKLFFFLFIIPFSYIKLVLKQDLSHFGFNLEKTKNGMLWSFVMLVIYFAAIVTFLYFNNYTDLMSIPSAAKINFWFFVVYVLIFLSALLFIQEFFFKGFLFFSFYKNIGVFSIFLPFIIYLSFLLLTGNLSFKSFPFLLISLGGGFITYKTRSFVYSFLSGLIFLIFLNSYLIYISRI